MGDMADIEINRYFDHLGGNDLEHDDGFNHKGRRRRRVASLEESLFAALTSDKPYWKNKGGMIRLCDMDDSHLTHCRNMCADRGFKECEEILAAEIDRRLVADFD